MIELTGEGASHTCDGMTRRDFLQVGTLGAIGLTLSQMEALKAAGAVAKDKSERSVIMIFNLGAPSQLDTFDMKPDAPENVRGEFQPIATNTPGIQICEHLPLLAARADKYAIVRSLQGFSAEHEHGTHMLLTGHDRIPPGAVLFILARRAATGPPLAVKRVRDPSLPLEFTLGPENRMIQSMPFKGPLQLSARLDADGNAMSREPGDLLGEVPGPVTTGAQGVEIVIDRSL